MTDLEQSKEEIIVNKYQRGKIYKLICNTTNKCYIGSTCEDRLCKRIQKHKDSYRRYQKGTYNYTSSYEIFANNNYDILLVENYPCNSKDELHSRERYWIENTENCVNRGNPICDKKNKAILDKLHSA